MQNIFLVRWFKEKKANFMSGSEYGIDDIASIIVALNILLLYTVLTYFLLFYYHENLPPQIILAMTLYAVCTIVLHNKKYLEIKKTVIKDMLLYDFGKYGNVVNRKAWKKFKANNKTIYKFMQRNQHNGSPHQRYNFSKRLALCVDDCEFVFCIFKDTYYIRDILLVNGNCIYSSYYKRHFNFEEFKASHEVVIYKTLPHHSLDNNELMDNVFNSFNYWCDDTIFNLTSSKEQLTLNL